MRRKERGFETFKIPARLGKREEKEEKLLFLESKGGDFCSLESNRTLSVSMNIDGEKFLKLKPKNGANGFFLGKSCLKAIYFNCIQLKEREGKCVLYAVC